MLPVWQAKAPSRAGTYYDGFSSLQTHYSVTTLRPWRLALLASGFWKPFLNFLAAAVLGANLYRSWVCFVPFQFLPLGFFGTAQNCTGRGSNMDVTLYEKMIAPIVGFRNDGFFGLFSFKSWKLGRFFILILRVEKMITDALKKFHELINCSILQTVLQ